MTKQLTENPDVASRNIPMSPTMKMLQALHQENTALGEKIDQMFAKFAREAEKRSQAVVENDETYTANAKPILKNASSNKTAMQRARRKVQPSLPLQTVDLLEQTMRRRPKLTTINTAYHLKFHDLVPVDSLFGMYTKDKTLYWENIASYINARIPHKTSNKKHAVIDRLLYLTAASDENLLKAQALFRSPKNFLKTLDITPKHMEDYKHSCLTDTFMASILNSAHYKGGRVGLFDRSIDSTNQTLLKSNEKNKNISFQKK